MAARHVPGGGSTAAPTNEAAMQLSQSFELILLHVPYRNQYFLTRQAEVLTDGGEQKIQCSLKLQSHHRGAGQGANGTVVRNAECGQLFVRGGCNVGKLAGCCVRDRYIGLMPPGRRARMRVGFMWSRRAQKIDPSCCTLASEPAPAIGTCVTIAPTNVTCRVMQAKGDGWIMQEGSSPEGLWPDATVPSRFLPSAVGPDACSFRPTLCPLSAERAPGSSPMTVTRILQRECRETCSTAAEGVGWQLSLLML